MNYQSKKSRAGAALLSAGALSALLIAGAYFERPARAQATGLPIIPLGYCQLTSIDAAAKISTCSGGIPAGANAAVIQAEAQAVRYRDDGVAPSATVGMPMAVAAPIYYAGTLAALQVISQTAGAKLDVLFYRAP